MEFFKNCNGIPIRINDSGKGDSVVVLLHGYLETMDVWEEFEVDLSKLFRVISLDLPGNGFSGSKDVNSMEFMADTLASVMDACGVNAATIVGHSMGGYVALAFAKKYYERTEKLCLFHSTPNADSDEKKKNRDREIEFIQQGKLVLIVNNSISNIFATKNRKKMSEKILEMEANAHLGDSSGIIACLQGMKLREDNNKFLKEFDKPCLWIHGKYDNHIPLELIHTMINTFTNCTHVLLENSGHAGFLEEKSYCLEVLSNFITE